MASCPARPVLIVQMPPGDISPFSLAQKFNPLASQSELRSCVII